MSVPLQTYAVMPEDSSLESLGALLSVQKTNVIQCEEAKTRR